MTDDLHMGLECILHSERSGEGEEHSKENCGVVDMPQA